MSVDIESFGPIGRREGRKTAVDVHEALRSWILSGRLKPGAILSQVEVARALHVSRTPVREAMRMLQEGGLLIGEPNRRSRVLGFDPKDVEALYMKRVVLESLGVVVTTRRMPATTSAEIGRVIEALESPESHRDFAFWQKLHREFHQHIVSEGCAALVDELTGLELRSERYQTASKGAHLPGWWRRGEAEHRGIFDAMLARNAARAGELAARHLARTALELLAALAPEYDTSGLRAGLQFAIAGASANAQ